MAKSRENAGVGKEKAGSVSPDKWQGGGESQGGAYPGSPNRKDGKEDDVLGHGGQSDIGYHGEGRLGDDRTSARGNPNAAASND